VPATLGENFGICGNVVNPQLLTSKDREAILEQFVGENKSADARRVRSVSDSTSVVPGQMFERRSAGGYFRASMPERG
jgi:hypothetical protein